MNFIVICCLNCSPECNWRTKKQSFQSFLNFSALSVNSYEKSMLKSLTQQHSSRLSLNSNFIVQVRDFFVLLFFFDFGNDWFSASRSGKALLKRIFSFECFLFLGKGRRVYAILLHSSSSFSISTIQFFFFLMIKKSEVWLLRNITEMRSLIWYAKPTLDFCMLNTKV